jgi:hypothetical protein
LYYGTGFAEYLIEDVWLSAFSCQLSAVPHLTTSFIDKQMPQLIIIPTKHFTYLIVDERKPQRPVFEMRKRDRNSGSHILKTFGSQSLLRSGNVVIMTTQT